MTARRRWRIALASAASAAMLVAAPLVDAQNAFAQYPPVSPITVNATTISAGGLLSFSTAPGVFPPGAIVCALLESKPVLLGKFRADLHGSVAGTVTIPLDTPSGWHVFRLTSDDPDPSVGISILVVGGVTPTPPPTKHPKPPGHKKPEHHKEPAHHKEPEHHKKPAHHKEPEHHKKPAHHEGPAHHSRHNGYNGYNGHDSGGRGHRRATADDRVSYWQGRKHHGRSLANTGSDKALAFGGTAAALVAVGGGTMLVVRRRRDS